MKELKDLEKFIKVDVDKENVIGIFLLFEYVD